jgi:hypothetical protein
MSRLAVVSYVAFIATSSYAQINANIDVGRGQVPFRAPFTDRLRHMFREPETFEEQGGGLCAQQGSEIASHL